jgi:hypothetical protein
MLKCGIMILVCFFCVKPMIHKILVGHATVKRSRLKTQVIGNVKRSYSYGPNKIQFPTSSCPIKSQNFLLHHLPKLLEEVTLLAVRTCMMVLWHILAVLREIFSKTSMTTDG